jgi:hypothetical protein
MAWTTITRTSIGLRWDPSADNVGVTGYRIYRNGTRIATVTSTSYDVTGLTCGTSYTIGLTAIDAAGNESYRPHATGTTSTSSCADTQPPSVPQGMAWTTITRTSIGVRWDPPTDNVGVTGYRIYRNGTLVGTTTATSYMASGLKCGTSYTIALGATDAAGNESNRAGATGTTSTRRCALSDVMSNATDTLTGTTAATGPQITSAKLSRKSICKASSTCATSANVVVELSEPATVAVQPQRVGTKSARAAARTTAKKVRRRDVLKIAAKSLKRGRYRLRVTAVAADGGAAKPVYLSLRVR